MWERGGSIAQCDLRGDGDEHGDDEPCHGTQAAYEASGVKHDGRQHAVDRLLASNAFHW